MHQKDQWCLVDTLSYLFEDSSVHNNWCRYHWKKTNWTLPLFVKIRIGLWGSCGGTIIPPYLVLTTADCLFNFDSPIWIQTDEVIVLKDDFTKPFGRRSSGAFASSHEGDFSTITKFTILSLTTLKAPMILMSSNCKTKNCLEKIL